MPAIQLTPENLLKAIQSEYEAIEYYRKLHQMTPDHQNAELIHGIYNDEVKHYTNFSHLYFQMTNNKPTVRDVVISIPNFVEGVKKAILDELTAYEFYRDIYLGARNDTIRNTFFEAFTDENEHASKFNFMYTKSVHSTT